MPSRVLYAGQSIILSGTSYGTRILPVQSANCEVSRGLEDILSFGHIGSLNRVQTSVTTCKSDIKTYLPANNLGTGLATDPSRVNSLDAEFINALTGDSLAGAISTISVQPNGFIMSGIFTNITVDSSVGQLATASLGFAGVGEPYFSPVASSNVYADQSIMPTSFTPTVSTFISGNATTGTAQTMKWSLDLPNETLASLGGVITGSQGQVASSFLQVGKPPFKTTVMVEGTSVATPTTGNGLYVIGSLGITLPNGKVISHNFNQAVGSIGATQSYTIEDVNVNLVDTTLGWS